MTLVETLLALVVDAALGGWLGAMAFFSFVGAPTAFRALDDEHAGRYVNAAFPKYYSFGAGLGAVAIGAWFVLTATAGRTAAATAGQALALVGVATVAYSRWVLVPKMEAAGDDAFQQYHRRSVLLNGLAMLAATAALVASHL